MKRHKDIVTLIFFVFVVFAFFYRTIVFGKLPVPSDTLVGLYHPYRDMLASQYPNGIPFKNFLITDPVRQQIPWRKSVVTALAKGKLPLWDASSFSGTLLLANIQSGAFYPLNIFFLFLPFEIAWTILIISQPLLAGTFLYWFLRRKDLDPVASLFGAICFAFSGFSIAWLTWGTIISTWLWTPLSLVALDGIHAKTTKNKIPWILLCIISTVFSFFAGHIQIFLYSVAFIGVYALWMFRKKDALVYIVIVGSIAVLTALQWTRMAQWLPETSRVAQGALWHAEGFFIPLKHLIQFVAPDYFGNPATLNYWGTWNYGEMVGYIGMGGLVLAGLGITGQTVFWVVMIVVSLLFAVASPISALPFQLHIPIISSLQPTRLVVIIDFCLSVLAAYGFSRLGKGVMRKKLLLPIILIGICLLGLWMTIPLDQSIVVKRNLIMPSTFYCLLFVLLWAIYYFHGKIKQCLIVLLFAVTLVDLIRFGWKFTPFTDRAYFFPTTSIISYLEKQPKPFRIMTTDDRIFPPNVNEYYGIESVNGYDPVHSLRYEEFIAAMERGKPNINPPFGFDRIIVPKNISSPLASLLSVRFVMSFDQLDDTGFKQVAVDGKTILYEKTDSRPRVYLVERAIFKNIKQDIINGLYDKNFDPITEAIVEYPVSVLNFPLETGETVIIQSYNDSEIVMRVNVGQPRLLVISNMYDRHWSAFIDKTPVNLYRTNYLFMGVVVPEGSHVVVLKYN